MSSGTRRLQNHAVPYIAWREARPAFKRAFDAQLAVFLAASIRYGNSTRAADRPCEQKDIVQEGTGNTGAAIGRWCAGALGSRAVHRGPIRN